MDKQLYVLSQTISRRIPGSIQKYTLLLGWGSSCGTLSSLRCVCFQCAW